MHAIHHAFRTIRTGAMHSARGGRAFLPAVLAAAALVPAPARAGFDSRPLPTRELLPPYLVFLLPSPETAELEPAGSWRVSLATSLSNSFAGTTAFRGMSSPIPGERLEVNRALVDNFLAGNPGTDLFFVDGEVLRSALRVAWGAHERVEIALELPLIRFTGGTLDGLIEDFHDGVGFPDDGRPNYLRRDFNVVLFLGDSGFLITEEPAGAGVGDLTLSAKTRLFRDPDSGTAVAGSLYVKLPTGDEEDLLGSGSADVAVQVHLTREWERHAVHLGAGAAYLGGWDLVPEIDPENLLFASGTYEWRMTRIWSMVWQFGVTASPFREVTADDLADPSLRINGGFRWRYTSGLSMEAVIEENLTRTNASADFGLFFGLSYRF